MKNGAKTLGKHKHGGETLVTSETGLQQSKVAVRFLCPHCQTATKLVMVVNMQLHDVTAIELTQPRSEGVTTKATEGRFQPAEQAILERAQGSGILDAFAETVRSRNNQVPAQMDSYFLHFLRTMTPRVIPMRILEVLREAYPDEHITIFASQGIACISAGGVMKFFAPVEKLLGMKLNSLGRNDGGINSPRLDVDENEIRNWIKTRRGYIPADSTEFLDALRRPSIGAYDKLSLSAD